MKKKNYFLVVIVIFTTSWLFNSCTKDESFEDILIATRQENQNLKSDVQFRITKDENSKELYTVLGKKRQNPFTVTSINQAKTNLYGASIPSKSSTHQYVKFLPSIQEHLANLEDWETEKQIPLFDFPLEYEVVLFGERYIDPTITDSIYTYQYASIPNGVDFPAVPYELIDELYLDKSDPLLLAESFSLTHNKKEINEYVFEGGLSIEVIETYDDDVLAAFKIPEIPDYPCPEGYEWVLVYNDSDPNDPNWVELTWECLPQDPPPPSPTNDCGCPLPYYRNPAGCVQVDNDGVMDPVQIASIKVKDTWFSGDVTTTDVNGCWRVNKNYSGKVWMWVRFKNNNVKVRDGRYWLGLRAVRDYVGRFTSPPYNNIQVDYSSGAADNTSNERMYWAAAHTLNTVNDYRTRAAADGVPLPRTGLNWYNHHGNGDASAAMLQGHVFNSWPAFFAIFLIPITYPLSTLLLPDITNKYAENETAARFTGAGYHELGHASHHSLVGESYWRKYRNHIINNDGYGSFGDFSGLGSHPERVALGEAIGNYTGAIYGGTFDGGEIGEWGDDNFIPQGLMFDLEDDTPMDTVTDPNDATITGTDNISGFTPNMIFNGLTPNVNSIRNFRDRLRVLHLSDTPNNAAAYNTFVDIYDVFNN